MKDEEWNKVINLNLTSSFLLSKYVIKKMLKNKNGKIINFKLMRVLMLLKNVND